MRGTAWDKTPQACCRGPDRAGCQEWLRGPSGTSLRHLTSALQLSPALTLSRLKARMELRQGRASGTWSITLCHIIRISPIRIFYNSFSITECGGSLSCHLCWYAHQMQTKFACHVLIVYYDIVIIGWSNKWSITKDKKIKKNLVSDWSDKDWVVTSRDVRSYINVVLQFCPFTLAASSLEKV